MAVGRAMRWLKAKATRAQVNTEAEELVIQAPCRTCLWNGTEFYSVSRKAYLYETRRLLGSEPGTKSRELSHSVNDHGCLCCSIIGQLIDQSLLGEMCDVTIEIDLPQKGYFVITWRHTYHESATQRWLFCTPDFLPQAVNEVRRQIPLSVRMFNLAKQVTVTPDNSSDAHLSWAKSQLSKCLEKHPRCRNSSEFVPTRLINVNPFASDRDVVLQEQSAIPPGSSYIALSHCWGPKEKTEIKCRTLLANVDSQRERIQWSALSRTFQDAVDFTRKLGQTYLWIDCICIIQESEQDWNQEAPRMFSVYHHALLTLSAHHARGSLEGLYSKSTVDRQTKITLPGEVADRLAGVEGSRIDGSRTIQLVGTQLDSVCPCNVEEQDSFRRYQFQEPSLVPKYWGGPLFTRAWTFQEQRVSPRVLAFTANDLVWECNASLACECKRRELGSTKGELNRPGPGGGGGRPRRKRPGGYGDEVWWDHVAQYSQLRVTNANDKLPAMAALAEQASKTIKIGDTYLAGLWSSSLVRDLLWASSLYDWQPRSARPRSLNRSRPDCWPAPTWSWASIQDPVMFLGHREGVLTTGFGVEVGGFGLPAEDLSIQEIVKVSDVVCEKEHDGGTFLRPRRSTCSLSLQGRAVYARLQKGVRKRTHIVFTIEMRTLSEDMVVIQNPDMKESSEDDRIVYVDYDPWPTRLPLLTDEDESEDNDEDDDDEDSDDEDDDDSNVYQIPGAAMDVELLEMANLQRNNGHVSSVIYMVLSKTTTTHHDGDRYERLEPSNGQIYAEQVTTYGSTKTKKFLPTANPQMQQPTITRARFAALPDMLQGTTAMDLMFLSV